MTDFIGQAEELFEFTRDLRRDLHRHPELGFQEIRTAGIVARELRNLGLEVTTGIGRTGVVAMLEGGREGPTLLLRFDMDALPIQEETGAEYASTLPGVMHACGHDGHTAVGLAVSHLLHGIRDELSGKVKLVFQPAEEGAGGAQSMLVDGVLENPRPDRSLALHLWNEHPVGWFGVSPGPTMSAAESFQVRLIGKGGHGASPHLAVDPVVASAQLINQLQTIVSRNVSALDSSIISVTQIQGGHAHNVIPMHVDIKGTIRYYRQDVGDLIHRRFKEVVDGVAISSGCKAEIETIDVCPAVVNDPELTERVARRTRELFPDEVVETDFQLMGSEDMSVFMNEIPGCYFFVGSADSGRGLNAPHHHPKFDFDEKALIYATALMAAAAQDFLSG
ncbi:MAG TPA: M20 family metallopeptidase [Anaerolineales bacterium]|nr:M20 family metallopeptidase [Anaerolineales bacterium]